MSATLEITANTVIQPSNRNSIVRTYAMGHGAMEAYSLKESRRFYEEFLGLECVRVEKPSIMVRCGMRWHIVAVEVGQNLHPAHLLNHWGLNMRTQQEVDEAYENALKYRDKYRIGEIMKPCDQHGVYSFYMEDLDHNWWEIQFCEGFQHDLMFGSGDLFPMD